MTDKRNILWRVVRTSSRMRVLLYFIAFLCIIAIYTTVFHAVYPLLENKPIDWPQSFLFVMETITTTGYGWLLPFNNQLTILLAAVMMLTGVIMIFMVIPLLLTPYLVAMLRSAPAKRTLKTLYHHTVIVGDGELTRALLESLALSDREVLIVEEDEETARKLAKKHRGGAFVIWGKYDDEQTWEQAWIKNADTVIICEDERTTASIILGLRGLTQAKIIAIVDKLSFDRYLRYAGADYVLSPKHVTGRILARHAVLNPAGDTDPSIPGLDRLTINAEGAPEKILRLIHIPVMPESKATGKKLGELDLFGKYGILVPFLWKAGRFVSRPDPGETMDTTTSLFLFGRVESLRMAVHEELEVNTEQIGHAVIAGYGDVGSAACAEMIASGVACVVVDAKKYDVNEVIGNAEDEEVLRGARIGEARFCIVAVNDDAVNIFTTLMARNLNPGIRILARANEPGSVDKLYRAGADYVALLPRIGGQAVGRIVLADTVTVLVDLPDGEMVVLRRVHKNAVTVGKLAASGVRILGIERTDAAVVAPRADEIAHAGDTVVAVGSTDQLKQFIRQC